MKKKTPRGETVATEVTINIPSPVRIGKRSPLPDLNSLLPKKHKAKPIPRIGPALALSGGAAHGDFEVGVVKYLYEHGLVPKIICGTSVGAINGKKPHFPRKRSQNFTQYINERTERKTRS